MPLLNLTTNARLADDQSAALLRTLSMAVADMLGKPERYVMVSLTPNPHMCFAGSGGPLAYIELKSIGLPEAHAGELSSRLCKLVSAELGIASERIYIEFSDARRTLWGWNGGTF